MSATRRGMPTLFAAITVGTTLSFGTLAHGADASRAELPAGLSRTATIKAIYPELYRAELARKDGVSWERLRRAARTAWMRSHPCATATLARLYRLGARSSWDTMVATWRCDRVDPGHLAFMRCIPAHEGGYGAPDVRFGGRTGNPTPHGLGNVVMGHLQLRPAWYRGAMAGRPGTYLLPDRWDDALYAWARNPVNQARATAPLGPEQYATRSRCS